MTYKEFRKSESIKPLDTESSLVVQNAIKFFSGDETVQVIPADDPEQGIKGFTARKINEEGNEESTYLRLKVTKEATVVRVDTRKEFEEIFEEAWYKDFPISGCDNPRSRILGFIVAKRTGRTLYQISLSKYKEDDILPVKPLVEAQNDDAAPA